MNISGFFKEYYNQHSDSFFYFLEKIGLSKIIRIILRVLSSQKKETFDLTNLIQLSKNISYISHVISSSEIHKSNDWYGHATILKNYVGMNIDNSIKSSIEHGVILDDCFWNQDALLSSIITFSKYRKDIINAYTSKKVYCIGPYIHYASHYLNSNRVNYEKNKLKRNLLVFPTHSTMVTNSSYDIKEFSDKLISMKRNFDSIRICLYWKDIENGIHHLYQRLGFECVTAGHIFDPLFLPRLKSIIETSTMTMSNAVGTYIGYCILLHKPHYIFSQQVNHQGRNKDEIRLITSIERNSTYKTIEKSFHVYSETISQEQYKLVDYYWGLSEIKSKEELRSIICSADKMY